MKRADWTGRKREKVGQLCPCTETGAVQGWAMVNCTHSINQSMTASLRRNSSVQKSVPYISGFRLFLLLLQLNHLSLSYSPLSSKLRQSTQGMAVLTRRQVDDGARATLRFLPNVAFFLLFRSWLKPPPPQGPSPNAKGKKSFFLNQLIKRIFTWLHRGEEKRRRLPNKFLLGWNVWLF